MGVQYTPGPWRADGPPHNRIVWCEGTDNRVCFMAHSDGADTERDIATSNVVAAAPELLEALETYANRYLLDEREQPELCMTPQHHADVLAVFAALAKARGHHND